MYWPDDNAPAEVRTSDGVVRVSANFEHVGTITIQPRTPALSDQACEGLAYNPGTGSRPISPWAA